MIWEITASLRAWSFSQSLDAQEFLRRLGMSESEHPLPEHGSARIDAFVLDYRSFQGRPEPSEDFAVALLDAFKKASSWLSTVPDSSVSALVQDGFVVDMSVDVCMDQDQMDLGLPPEFALQLSRLRIPLAITTRSWEIETRLQA